MAPKIAHLNAGVVDGGQPMRNSWFETITAFAGQHLSVGVGVLVHCHSGINRSPSAAFAVQLSIGWDPVEAIELIRTQRPIATVSYAENALDWWHRSSGVHDHDRALRRAPRPRRAMATTGEIVHPSGEVRQAGRPELGAHAPVPATEDAIAWTDAARIPVATTLRPYR